MLQKLEYLMECCGLEGFNSCRITQNLGCDKSWLGLVKYWANIVKILGVPRGEYQNWPQSGWWKSFLPECIRQKGGIRFKTPQGKRGLLEDTVSVPREMQAGIQEEVFHRKRGQTLESPAQGGGGVTIPGGVYKDWMWHLVLCSSWGVGAWVGLDDLKGLSQPRNSGILGFTAPSGFSLHTSPFLVFRSSQVPVPTSPLCFKLGSGLKPRPSWLLSGFPSAPAGVCATETFNVL